MAESNHPLTASQIYSLKHEFENRDERSVTEEDLDAHARRGEILAAEERLGGKVFRIPLANRPDLERRIEKINKRALKLNLPPVTLIDTGETEMVERRRLLPDIQREVDAGILVAGNGFPDEFFETYYIEYRYLLLTGETPRVAGYEFAATLEHEDGGPIIRRVPRFEGGEIDLSFYRTAKPETCDHCGFVRNRKDTYVVWNADTQETKQVGRTCLRDFTGANDPESVARMAEMLRDLVEDLSAWGEDEEFGDGGGGEHHYRIDDFLANAARMIRQNGWTPRSKAQFGATPTADQALQNMSRRTHKNEVRYTVEEEDIAKAQETLEWVRSDEFAEEVERELRRKPDNDYLHNLHVSTQADFITARKAGIVASALSALDRRREDQIRRGKGQGEQRFVGEVGKRSDFTLTLTRTIWLEDRFSYDGGSKPLYMFIDPEGNSVKWFASNEPFGVDPSRYGIDEGTTYHVRATVKRHEDDPRFGKSTIITRAKILAPVDEQQEVLV